MQMFRTTLALLTVTAAAAIGSQAAAAQNDPWYGYAISYSSPAFTTDTLAPGGGSSAPAQGYRFVTDTLAPGGGTSSVAVSAARGFSWADAGIGAAVVAATALVLLGGLRAVASRRSVVAA